MRDARTRFFRIGGALLAIGVLLAAALHLAEQSRRSASAPALAEADMHGHGVSVATRIAPIGIVLEIRDATADQTRPRILAYALVPQPAARTRIERELERLAEAVKREHPQAGAITVLGYRCETERAALGDAAPWRLEWSPDGRGWDGLGDSDFGKHIYCAAR